MADINSNHHFEVLVDGSIAFTEKCRNSWGGFLNLMDRVAGRLGVERLRSEDGGETWLADGHRVEFVEVHAL